MPRVNVVLMGPPGCGKGTQAARIATRYGIPHISTGDMLRAAVREGSALGRQVEATLASGGLVGDELMTELVRARLQHDDVAAGFILDGFPRTVAQALALETMPAAVSPIVVLIDVADAEIVRRIGSRRVCASCRLTQSVSGDSDPDRDACPYCGGRLEVRKDDDPQTVARRLRTYGEYAAPMVAHYRAKSWLAVVDGSGRPDAVTARVWTHIDRHCGWPGSAR